MTLPNDAVDNDPMLPELFTISSYTRDRGDTFTLELEVPDSFPAPHFKPGQFNMLYLFGHGEIPLSISSASYDKGVLCHTVKEVGSTTKALGKLRKGDKVGIRGPFGSQWPIENLYNKDIMLIAGGLGIAPLRPVIYHITKHRKNYGRVTILYGAKSPDEILYMDELEQWDTSEDIEINIIVDKGNHSWTGKTGLVTKLIDTIKFNPDNLAVMVCGPEIMMTSCINTLLKKNVSATHIYLSMERNMKCAVGLCGRCQFGSHFICKDGPVYPYDKIKHLLKIKGI